MSTDTTVRLTKHFTLDEAIRSATATKWGIDNTPGPEDLATIHRTAIKMEQVREILGLPIIVSSWFRGAVLNLKVGGVPNSQHQKGEAVDFSVFGRSPHWAVQQLRAHAEALQYDQLILEPNWVHISFLTSHKSKNYTPRMQYLDLSK